MSEPRNELQRINWSECFPFTRVFGTFKLAIHPGKLGLALAAVLLTLLWGGFLDLIWFSKHQPIGPEVNAFWQVSDIDAWRQAARNSAAQDLRAACQSVGAGKALPAKLEARLANKPGEAIADALAEVKEQYQKALDDLQDKLKDKDKESEEEVDEAAAVAALARPYHLACQKIRSRAPQGVFCSFLDYQATVGKQLLEAARGLNFANGLTAVITSRTSPSDVQADLGAIGVANPVLALGRPGGLTEIRSGSKGFGVLSCVVLSIRGWQWMVLEHFWFLLLFSLPTLLIWSLFGGAICRMAALNVARDERISPKTALAFARRKLVSFFTAPLFPVLLIVGIGVFLFLGGLVTAVPGIGEILGGVAMGLALLGGFLIAAVVTGAVGGGWLMWPTIAVEGSDSFDAISRSYSYVYARPWRAAFYVAVGTVYGAITYLFTRFFILVVLKASRLFVGFGMWMADRPGTGNPGATKIDTLWPAPSWSDLKPASVPIGMENWDAVGAFLVCIWVTIAVALLCAFLASFFLSGSTIIYYLLRREVDATDVEDVYLEEEEGEEAPFDVSEAADREDRTTESESGPLPEAPSCTCTETGPAPSVATEPPPVTPPEPERPQEPELPPAPEQTETQEPSEPDEAGGQ